MLDLMSRLAPVELAGLGWVGLNHAVVATEIAARMAVKQFEPACVAHVADLQARRVAAHEAERKRLQGLRDGLIAEAEQRARSKLEEIRRLEEGLGAVLGATPFGEILDGLSPSSDAMAELKLLLPQLSGLNPDALAGALGVEPLELQVIPAPLAAPDPAAQATFCGCVVSGAIAQHHADFTAYTASLTTYRPEAVLGFDGVVAALIEEGACGGLPLS
ncbi:MAG: hypothetical protein AAF713_19085 [Pseudomonadota bacterium]